MKSNYTIKPTCFKSDDRTPLGPVVAKKLKVKPVSQKGTQSDSVHHYS